MNSYKSEKSVKMRSRFDNVTTPVKYNMMSNQRGMIDMKVNRSQSYRNDTFSSFSSNSKLVCTSMSGYYSYGTEMVSLRGYENNSLTPYVPSAYNSNGYAYAGNVYDKFTIELRYPVILQPQSTIYALLFLEGGNCWSDIKEFNPFQIKRSAGVGVRIFLPMVGLLGVDWGWGFDGPEGSKSQFHFVIGQQF